MGIPFTMAMGFLFTVTMGKLFTMTLGIQLTISIKPLSASPAGFSSLTRASEQPYLSLPVLRSPVPSL